MHQMCGRAAVGSCMRLPRHVASPAALLHCCSSINSIKHRRVVARRAERWPRIGDPVAAGQPRVLDIAESDLRDLHDVASGSEKENVARVCAW